MILKTENEVWLNRGASETFTSPNYPLKYNNGDSKDWVFCVSGPCVQADL